MSILFISQRDSELFENPMPSSGSPLPVRLQHLQAAIVLANGLSCIEINNSWFKGVCGWRFVGFTRMLQCYRILDLPNSMEGAYDERMFPKPFMRLQLREFRYTLEFSCCRGPVDWGRTQLGPLNRQATQAMCQAIMFQKFTLIRFTSQASRARGPPRPSRVSSACFAYRHTTTCTQIYMSICISMYVYTYVYRYACMHACMHVCMYATVCIYVCMYVCLVMYVCMIQKYAHTYTCTFLYRIYIYM